MGMPMVPGNSFRQRDCCRLSQSMWFEFRSVANLHREPTLTVKPSAQTCELSCLDVKPISSQTKPHHANNQPTLHDSVTDEACPALWANICCCCCASLHRDMQQAGVGCSPPPKSSWSTTVGWTAGWKRVDGWMEGWRQGSKKEAKNGWMMDWPSRNPTAKPQREPHQQQQQHRRQLLAPCCLSSCR